MRNVAKGDVSKLCEHTRELICALNAAGETTNDLLANLIEALKEAPDVNFQRWLSNHVDLWSIRKLDWKQDGSDLMDEAEVYYQEAINTHRWGKKTHKQDVVYAFRTEESESEVEEQPSNPYEDTIKALTAQLKEYAEAYTARWGNPGTSEDREKKYAWSSYHQRIMSLQRRGCTLMESLRCSIGVHIIYNGQYTALVSVRGNHQG
jgi:hypothetical protein